MICSVLMYPAVLRDLRRECLLCFGADWCSLGRGVRGAVSWECPELSERPRFPHTPLDKFQLICYYISNNSPRPLWQHMHTWGLFVI